MNEPKKRLLMHLNREIECWAESKKYTNTNRRNNSDNGNENPFLMQYVEDYNVIVMAY